MKNTTSLNFAASCVPSRVKQTAEVFKAMKAMKAMKPLKMPAALERVVKTAKQKGCTEEYTPEWQYEDNDVWHKCDCHLGPWLEGLDADEQKAVAESEHEKGLRWRYNMKTRRQLREECRDGEWVTASTRRIRRILVPREQ